MPEKYDWHWLRTMTKDEPFLSSCLWKISYFYCMLIYIYLLTKKFIEKCGNKVGWLAMKANTNFWMWQIADKEQDPSDVIQFVYNLFIAS